MSDSPDRRLALKVAGIGLAMFAFGFALVPLYDVFCAVTGFGGKTASAAVAVVEEPDQSRTVRVEFLASVPRGVPFTLEPEVSHLDVHPGQMYETHFRARNLTGSPRKAQAVPSVAPGAAARYFNKAECFCFTSQEFQPNEELTLKLAFMVAADLPAHIDTLSLSYTYFSASN
ncbi:MAG TPA: cytochrome c oxidase assembly protein [Gammaproteobacteria bacterium]